ncbi:hypothetical protein N9922_00395 [Cyclobacteriaceae bacterium]|jgi:antitoxin component YwqK of YwqJK toxin-antitoxin module|nr:hypothetical protein [Cyclobacteriaceae bacterium]MDB4290651.1 hypothetical protein [Cyclobacteriaceae bacterium]MDB4316061.1 hypothetical protein [Cyclobacteriaceae bacterium]MDB4741984.1 hypothetical protein [Cyclobacteriaceae bacterium]|tara:strand:+ start:624 stop:1457 length:834 start_codon:yes stop_codon:yes gene_type:complete
MKTLLYSFCVLTLLPLLGQEAAIVDLFKVAYETPLTIALKDLKAEEDPDLVPDTKKEKKLNPKVYYDIKGKKGFVKTTRGRNTTTELFYFLKEKDFEDPSLFDQDFYYLDRKKKRIVNSKKIKEGQKIGLMHGKYIKKLNDEIIEEGFYYKGKKHMRWVRFDRNDILQDKEIYWKGWTQQSLLRFYDLKRENLREVIPIHFGDRQGTYYAFHSNGNVAATGEYMFDEKIGLWREYYENKRSKREIKYPKEPFQKGTPPAIFREWNEKGVLIYDSRQP